MSEFTFKFLIEKKRGDVVFLKAVAKFPCVGYPIKAEECDADEIQKGIDRIKIRLMQEILNAEWEEQT